MNQPIFLNDHGQLVATHQRHLNDRLRAHGNEPVKADGDCGPQTIKKSAYAAWFLGALDGSVQVVLAGTIGPGVQSMIADPDSRVGEQRTRAAERKGKPFPFATADVAAPLKHIITHKHGYGAGHDGVDLICDESARSSRCATRRSSTSARRAGGVWERRPAMAIRSPTATASSSSSASSTTARSRRACASATGTPRTRRSIRASG